MNNQEGEITVGENLPFPGAMMGTALTGAATVTPYLSVNRQDVALKLKLLPSVNEHNVIRLDVEQEVSDVEAAELQRPRAGHVQAVDQDHRGGARPADDGDWRPDE